MEEENSKLKQSSQSNGEELEKRKKELEETKKELENERNNKQSFERGIREQFGKMQKVPPSPPLPLPHYSLIILS